MMKLSEMVTGMVVYAREDLGRKERRVVVSEFTVVEATPTGRIILSRGVELFDAFVSEVYPHTKVGKKEAESDAVKATADTYPPLPPKAEETPKKGKGAVKVVKGKSVPEPVKGKGAKRTPKATPEPVSKAGKGAKKVTPVKAEETPKATPRKRAA